METYEQKYNIALDWARKVYPRTCGKEKEDLERVFPDLKESEDERIRKLLVWQVHRNIEDETNDLAQSVYDGIKGHDPDLEESIEDWKRCLAYLEKQKECSFYNFPKSCDDCPKEIQAAIDKKFGIDGRDDNDNPLNGYGDWKKGMVLNGPAILGLVELGTELHKEQQPAEWSEEDEDKLKKVIATVQCAGNRVNNNATNIGLINWLQNRLKSLRPQPHWKPSEEQMSSLWQASIYYKSGKIKITGKTLESLYNDLQKL